MLCSALVGTIWAGKGRGGTNLEPCLVEKIKVVLVIN